MSTADSECCHQGAAFVSTTGRSGNSEYCRPIGGSCSKAHCTDHEEQLQLRRVYRVVRGPGTLLSQSSPLDATSTVHGSSK